MSRFPNPVRPKFPIGKIHYQAHEISLTPILSIDFRALSTDMRGDIFRPYDLCIYPHIRFIIILMGKAKGALNFCRVLYVRIHTYTHTYICTYVCAYTTGIPITVNMWNFEWLLSNFDQAVRTHVCTHNAYIHTYISTCTYVSNEHPPSMKNVITLFASRIGRIAKAYEENHSRAIYFRKRHDASQLML